MLDGAEVLAREVLMPSFVHDKVEDQVRAWLRELSGPVRLVHFTQKHACGACKEQRALLEELAHLSDHLTLEVLELVDDGEQAARYGIDKVPATAVMGERDQGIRFYGLTGGYEFGSLLEAIKMVSTGQSGLEPDVAAMVRQIHVPLHLEVMVTLTCPYCPRMVRLAHQLAFVNDLVRSDMVDAAEFPELAQRYQVQGVPRIVVNERPAFEGAVAPAAAVLEILRLADPETYEAMDASLREARGERKTTAIEGEQEYDILAVGAGPAAMSAALYASRKGRRVALVGVKPGGQITDTAQVDNYLGMMEVGGSELAEMFRHHLETQPIAERLHARVARVNRKNSGFEVQTVDGRRYRARSVIYAAGKQYRRLGVPGEDRFIGHGIAFCATCDAPLFRDKTVAVVGGGNSALTAVRDLLGFAREIHLIHMLDTFQADAVLTAAIHDAPGVTVHMQTRVTEFLGGTSLTGVRVSSSDRGQTYDLLVDGVFLEVGLIPNTAPVADLVKLNGADEIETRRDQSTDVPGLFAAGDATNGRDKQIIIAAGDGAQAALSADRYLIDRDREAPATPGRSMAT